MILFGTLLMLIVCVPLLTLCFIMLRRVEKVAAFRKKMIDKEYTKRNYCIEYNLKYPKKWNYDRMPDFETMVRQIWVPLEYYEKNSKIFGKLDE